jgi:exocyst complex protein 7
MLGTLTDAMSASFLPEAEDTDVHPVTKAVAEGTRSLLEHRDSLNLILAHSCCRVHEGAPAIESLDSLISGLILHLKSVLQRSCKELLPKESQYIFLLNNMQFILNQFKCTAMEEPIGHGDWAIEHDKTMEHYMELYIETCWAPVSSHLAAKDGKRLRFWRHSCMQQFTVAFQSVYAKQRHWKVPDPHLRQALRASVSRKLIPAYCEYLEKHQNGIKSLRITREELEDLLSELFEG